MNAKWINAGLCAQSAAIKKALISNEMKKTHKIERFHSLIEH